MRALVVALGILALVSACALAGYPNYIPTPAATPIAKYSYYPFMNVTKLIITPNYKFLRLKPGENTSFTVTIKNPNDKDVYVKPRVIFNPFSPLIPFGWVKLNKTAFKLKAGKSAVVKVFVSVPKKARKGYYSCQIAFTNDKIPALIPKYVNALTLNINVYVTPSVKIIPKYISDVVKAGNTYRYNITIVNKACRSFSINPVYVRPEYSVNAIPEKDIKITSPAKIPPNSSVNVTLTVKIPKNASGTLSGSIYLNINDPGLDRWMQTINLNFRVYRVLKPYVKEIIVKNAKYLEVKVSSYPPVTYPPIIYPLKTYESNSGMGISGIKVKLLSPNGASIKPELIEKEVISVSNGYRVISKMRTYVYSVKNPENGIWKLEVLPEKSLSFTVVVDIK